VDWTIFTFWSVAVRVPLRLWKVLSSAKNELSETSSVVVVVLKLTGKFAARWLSGGLASQFKGHKACEEKVS